LREQSKLLDANSEEYAEMQKEIAELVQEEWELESGIKEALRDKLEIVKDVEDEITEIYEKEYERREKEIEDFHDKQIELLEKEKDAYNEMRDEQEYKKSVNEQIEEIAKLNQQIETAKRDTTIGGAKRLKELTEELREAQEELEEMTQDKIDSDYENNIDKEIERLEDQEETLLKNLEEKFSEENVCKMVAQAMSSGVIEINGEIKSLQDAMIESINSSAEGYSVMAQVVKNELVSNLGIALETVKELENVVIDNAGKIAIMAGASTPKESIEEVERYLKNYNNK
jgi:4-hydroxy-3-methylbut-2-enyl diphosphate reductase IspH